MILRRRNREWVRGPADGSAPNRRPVLWQAWRFVRAVARTVTSVVLVFAVTPAAVTGVVGGVLLFAPVPYSVPEPAPVEIMRPTQIFTADGRLLAELRTFDSSLPFRPEDVPRVLIDAVVAAEDANFWTHDGIDIRATVRALVADVEAGEVVQGGSTITQQYVKNTYVGSEETLERKFNEAQLASAIERELSKDEILYRYLQRTYFGEGAYGAAAAAETYFAKPMAELDVSEAAMIAGMIPAPSAYSPRTSIDAAERKRQIVLGRMLDVGYLTQAEYDAELPRTVRLAETPAEVDADGNVPPGTIVAAPPTSEVLDQPYFVDYVRRYVEGRYGNEVVYEGGLQIYVTLDERLQAEAEAAAAKVLDASPGGVEASIVAVEPGTGHVKALVGGRDFNAPGGQVNLALGRLGGGSGRQPGSSFKPFVLAEAFANGLRPTETVSGAPHVLDDGSVVNNYGGAVYGQLSLREATKRSSNTVFTRLIDRVGVEETMARAETLGVDLPAYDPAVHGVSVALGALDVAPLDMAAGYSVFAARGNRAPATPVALIIDADGTVIEDNRAPESVRELDEVVADNLNSVLTGPLSAGGTASRWALKGFEAAGKTGTTQSNRDAWFVGYTPRLSTAVWLGYRDEAVPLRNIAGVGSVTGGTLPAQMWHQFMTAALAGTEPVSFAEPALIPKRVEVTIVDAVEDTFRPGRKGTVTTTPRDWDPFPAPLPLPSPPAPVQTIPTTTTTTPAPTTTTTTTAPPGSTTTTTSMATTTTTEPDAPDP